MKKIDWTTVLKVLLAAGSIGIGLGQSIMADKDLKKKVAEEVAEALKDK